MGVIPFQKPNKVVMTKSNDAHGVFEFFPLEKGYGVTIGNAMRRVLLSSLEGYAISGVEIQGVEHEFSTIKGVVEDVVEIVLNLKQVRFKSNTSTEEQEKLFISIKGKDQFLAGDIGRYTNDYVILNPDHVICNMDPTVNLEMELIITKGRGYVPAEENKQKEKPDFTHGFSPKVQHFLRVVCVETYRLAALFELHNGLLTNLNLVPA